MTLLYFDGFTDVATYPKPEWSGGRIAATGRDGSTNGALDNNNDNDPRILTLPTPAVTCIAAAAAYWTGAVTNAYMICLADSANTDQLVIGLSSAGVLQLRRNSMSGTLLGTGPTVPSSTWHQYALKAILTTATTSTIYVYMDGSSTPVITVTGVATSSLTSSVYYVKLMAKASGDSRKYYFDDFYVCDAVDATSTQGRTNNDYLGDLKVAALLPSANGDTTQWTCSTGSNHAALIDEQPPNTTDYVSDSVSGHRDLVALADAPALAATVYGVRQSYYGQKSDAGASSIKPNLKENSVVTAATAQALSTSWGPFFGPQYIVRPSDSGLWTVTDVNNLQAGVEIA